VTDKVENDTAVAEPQPAAAPAAPPTPNQAIAKAPVRMGMAPATIEEGYRLANLLATTELVPKGYRGKPADIVAAIQYGMEVGLPPMSALHSIYVTNGRPAMWGEGLMGVIMSSPLYKDHEEYYLLAGGKKVDVLTATDLKNDDTTAVTTFWRRDNPRPRTASFSIAQAKKANLLGKEGPWQTYPDRMLKMRARGFAARDAFPDLLRGIKTVEEVRDIPADEDDPNIIDTAPIEPRRASDAPKAETPATAPAATPAAPAPANVPPAAAAPPREQIRGLTIMHTAFVRPKGVEPYYEIGAVTSTGQGRSFITRDEQVYKDAAALEGTDQEVVLTIHSEPHPAPTPKVKEFVFVDAIANYEPAASAGLFAQP
jgi:hypothetical protein